MDRTDQSWYKSSVHGWKGIAQRAKEEPAGSDPEATPIRLSMTMMHFPKVMPTLFGVDPTGTTSFIGALNRVAYDDDPSIDCEVAIDEHRIVPGATGTVPMTLPDGYHSMDNPELRFTMIRTYPLTTDWSKFHNTVVPPAYTSYSYGASVDDVNAFSSESFPQKAQWIATVNAGSTPAQQNSNWFPTNTLPLALGWPTKIGAYAMFDFFRWFSDGTIVEEMSREIDYAKFVEKHLAIMSPEESAIFDYKTRANIMQDSTLQQNIRPLEGYMGSWFMSSARVVPEGIEVMTPMTLPLPFYMGPKLPIHFIPNGRLQFALNTNFKTMFDAPMRYFSGFMEMATDSNAVAPPRDLVSTDTQCMPIIGCAISTAIEETVTTEGLSCTMSDGCDATAWAVFSLRAMKLSIRNVESILGDEQTVLMDDGRLMFPACSLFQHGMTVFSRVSKMARRPQDHSDNNTLFIARDQYTKSFIPASMIAGVVKGSPFRPAKLFTVQAGIQTDKGDPGMCEQGISMDDEVYIVFNRAVPIPCALYGAIPGVLITPEDGADRESFPVVLGANVPVGSSIQGDPVWNAQVNNIGFSYMVVLNAPISQMNVESNVPEQVQTVIGTFNNSTYSTAFSPSGSAADSDMVYPTDMRLENVRLGFTARQYKPNVLARLTSAYESPEGIVIGRVAPVMLTYNQTTTGRQIFQFSTFMSSVAYMQFELYRTNSIGLGRERMLPCSPIEEYSLLQGSYKVQSNDGASQAETFGNKFPTGYQDWATGVVNVAVTTGSIGEADHFDRIATCVSNCYAGPVTVNIANLHRMRTWGVHYPMNTSGGMAELRNREDWSFTYTACSQMKFNSNELGYCYSSLRQIVPGLQYVYSVSDCRPYWTGNPGELPSYDFEFLTTLGVTQKTTSSVAFSPTYMMCTVWGKLQFVLQKSHFKSIVPATVVTINS